MKSFLKRHEKYLVLLVISSVFTLIIMFAIRQMFASVNPKNVNDSATILGLVFTVVWAYFTWRSDKAQQEREDTLRREISLRQEMKEAIASLEKQHDNLQQQIIRLAAQVEQTDAETLLKRKINQIEQILNKINIDAANANTTDG